MNRSASLTRLKNETFDVLIVGGGATGLGCAVDAAARGYKTALVEAEDFAKATSSRSTKLVHGGVRYLQQGNVALVREALHERTRLRSNAPGLVREMPFLVPAYRWWEAAYHACGLRLYDVLAGASGFPRSTTLSAGAARERLANIKTDGLRAATLYWDAQFDDARMAIALARTASDSGAAIANYVRASGLLRSNERICGIEAVDAETDDRFSISARAVINATGIFSDALRRLENPGAAPVLTYSRGSHIVVDNAALKGASTALLVPRTSDGRVLFAVPWYGRMLVGTTDVQVGSPEIEPKPSEDEISFILSAFNRYLARPVSRADIRSAFAGLRPLITRSAANTAMLSREHLVETSASGVVTVTGGKWTTYRKMAQDAVDAAERCAGLGPVASPTADLRLRDDTAYVSTLDGREVVLHAAREEMARTVEDVLARRTRLLFVDAREACSRGAATAALLAQALSRSAGWAAQQTQQFEALASRYIVSP